MRTHGRVDAIINNAGLMPLSPLEWEHITLTGVYRWDLDGRPSARRTVSVH